MVSGSDSISQRTAQIETRIKGGMVRTTSIGGVLGAGAMEERLRAHDVEDDEGLPRVEEVVDGPLQCPLAAAGEVQRHPDLPVARHSLFLLSAEKGRRVLASPLGSPLARGFPIGPKCSRSFFDPAG